MTIEQWGVNHRYSKNRLPYYFRAYINWPCEQNARLHFPGVGAGPISAGHWVPTPIRVFPSGTDSGRRVAMGSKPGRASQSTHSGRGTLRFCISVSQRSQLTVESSLQRRLPHSGHSKSCSSSSHGAGSDHVGILATDWHSTWDKPCSYHDKLQRLSKENERLVTPERERV
jgi:hypothetical protein